ncbi:MAG: hypothetical protein WC713_01915 [Candidatus Methylomirabilota bacterium]
MTTTDIDTDLTDWRARISEEQRGLLDRLWAHYRDRGRWPERAALQADYGAAVQAACRELGQAILCPCESDEGGDCCRLTFLGVLLTSQGREAEDLLARYLEYVRGRCQADPRIEWVSSRDVEAALALDPTRSRLLRQLIRLSHWWGGGSGFGDREWTVGVPIDVDELPREGDLAPYVRMHVVRHFFPQPARASSSPAPAARPAFWFVRGPGLDRRLSADWREAHEVFGVRGWKSCLLLCGGILEAVLLDALAWGEPDPRHLPTSGVFRSATSLARRPLAELVKVASDRGLLAAESLQIGPALAAFPALAHPGRRTRRRIDPTRDEAEAALQAVQRCLGQLSARAAERAG